MSDYLQELTLTTADIGRHSRFYPRIGSTNQDAAKLAEQGAPHGTLLVAEQQTAGRGRLERRWFSPPEGNIYASLILRPRQTDPMRLATLPILAGLAIAEAVAKCFPKIEPQIKWPNDIWIREKKLCGILCEMQLQDNSTPAIILGFGININLTAEQLPEDLASTATSLRIETGQSCSRAKILSSILNTLEPLYLRWKREGLTPFLQRLRDRDALCGKEISMALTNEPLHGIGNGIRSDGGLRILHADGRESVVYSGEANHIRKEQP